MSTENQVKAVVLEDGTEVVLSAVAAALKEQEELRSRQEARDAAERKIRGKETFIASYQQNRITAEEFMALTGQTYVEALAERYEQNLFLARAALAVSVYSKRLTPEEFEEITGVAYEQTDYR